MNKEIFFDVILYPIFENAENMLKWEEFHFGIVSPTNPNPSRSVREIIQHIKDDVFGYAKQYGKVHTRSACIIELPTSITIEVIAPYVVDNPEPFIKKISRPQEEILSTDRVSYVKVSVCATPTGETSLVYKFVLNGDVFFVQVPTLSPADDYLDLMKILRKDLMEKGPRELVA